MPRLTRTGFITSLKNLVNQLENGCGDGGCPQFKGGQHTNGGCRCRPEYFSAMFLELAMRAEQYKRERKFDEN